MLNQLSQSILLKWKIKTRLWTERLSLYYLEYLGALQQSFHQLVVQLLEYVHLFRLIGVFYQAFRNFELPYNFHLHPNRPNIVEKDMCYFCHRRTESTFGALIIIDWYPILSIQNLVESWHIAVTTSTQMELTLEENIATFIECESLNGDWCSCLWIITLGISVCKKNLEFKILLIFCYPLLFYCIWVRST